MTDKVDYEELLPYEFEARSAPCGENRKFGHIIFPACRGRDYADLPVSVDGIILLTASNTRSGIHDNGNDL